MKRSDIIKTIMDAFELEGLGCIMREKDAEAILEAIEKAGMVPPLDESKSFKMLHSGEMIYEVREWEKENA